MWRMLNFYLFDTRDYFIHSNTLMTTVNLALATGMRRDECEQKGQRLEQPKNVTFVYL